MTAETIARKWHDQMLSTEPVDHAQTEAAVRAVYRAAGLPEPQRFLWCSSPLEAVWAALVIIGKTDGYNHAVLEDVERSKAGKARLAEVRAMVAGRLGIADGEIEGAFGRPFYRAEGFDPVAKRLMDDAVESWMARAEAGDDFLAVHSTGPFKPLHDLEHELFFEGYRFRNGEQQGSLYNQALAKAGNKHVAILGNRSAHHRLYGNFAFVEVALDQALAEAGKLQPTDLQRAIWAAYEACGMWWPCLDGVVGAERPVAAELTPEGPRIEWADGFTVGGKPSAQAPRPAPASTPAAPAPKHVAILDAALPCDHGERLAFLRRQSAALPHLDRYLTGEHEQVWKDLVALGDEVRTEAHAADALAVAYETMHRVEQNVRLLAERLRALGYSFVEPGSGSRFFGLGKPAAHQPHVSPGPDSAEQIAELENAVGGPIPLSLRAFFDVVGAVNFNGRHPVIDAVDGDYASDPLMVYGVQDAIDCVESGFGEEDDDDERKIYVVAPDALHKANVSGGDPYVIALPSPTADARLKDEPHDVTLVEYLRIAVRWGGFPGWENAGAALPDELEQLRRDLIPF